MMRTTWSLLAPLVLFACAAEPASVLEGEGDENGPPGATSGNEQNPSQPSTGNGDASTGNPSLAPGAVTIRVHYPAGSSKIGVRGTGGPLAPDKTTPLTAGADDTWEIALGVVSSAVEYRPMLDEQAAKGPAYKADPGETVDIYPYFKGTTGAVVTKWASYASTALPSKRNIRVYTPPSYDENTKARYPVLYVHDGQTAFKGSSSPNQLIDGCLAVDTAMDQGVESGAVAEAIVVAVDNGSGVTDLTGQQRSAELTPTANPQLPSSGKGPQYAKMMIEEIKPMVDKEYRTKPEREYTATIGSSLGGLMSAFLASDHGDVFGVYGSQSAAYWWDNGKIIDNVKAAIGGPNKPLRVYIDYGENEVQEPDYTKQLVAPTAAMVKALKDGGYVDGQTLIFNLGPKGGGHNSKTWGTRIPTALPFLVGAGR